MGELTQDENNCHSLPARIILTILGFLTITGIYSHRVVLNVAIVAMVNNSAIELHNENYTNIEECSNPKLENETNTHYEGRFNWNQTTQGIILGGFYYGYMIAQLISGLITSKFGAKKILVTTVFINSIMVILTPMGAELGVVVVTSLRVLIGLAQGLSYPAVYTLFGRWAPIQERSTLVTICTSGNQIGTVLAMSLTGFLCEYGFAGGWPSAFYVLGIAGCVVTALLAYFVYDSPAEHPRIATREYEYISKNISNTTLNSVQAPKIPWKCILTSGPVWAVAIAKICWSWGFYTLLSKLPSYLANVLHFPVDQNGLINALVYTSNSISLIFAGYLSDVVMKRKYLRPTTVRKVFETIGLLGPALCLIAIPAAGCDSLKVIILLTVAMGLFGFIGGGDMVAVVDLAPDFAGTLFGLTNGVACIPGFLTPAIAGILLDNDQGSMKQWSYIFYISSGFYIIGIITFIILGSAEIQPWAVNNINKEILPYTKEDQKHRIDIDAISIVSKSELFEKQNKL